MIVGEIEGTTVYAATSSRVRALKPLEVLCHRNEQNVSLQSRVSLQPFELYRILLLYDLNRSNLSLI